MRDVLVVLVVETTETVKSDDAYYGWILKNFFANYVSSNGFNNLRIKYRFVYMSGKTNYQNENVQKDLKREIDDFKPNKAYVVYCFDIDNKTIKNKEFLNGVEQYCLSNNYLISLAYKEIEDVLNVPNPKETKHNRVKLFRKKYPKKDAFDIRSFFALYKNVASKVGQTNFGLVIQHVIDAETKSEE